MKVHIVAKQLVLTEPLKEYIRRKITLLERFVKRFESKRELIVRFEISRTTKHHSKGNVYYAEATIHVPGKDIRAEHTHSDARAAVDAVKNTLKGELVRYKEKLIGR